MKYRLALCDGDTILIGIDYFPGLDNLNPYNLHDIITFTHSFDDSTSFFSYLVDHNLINAAEQEFDIGIFECKKVDDIWTKLPFGISYKKESDYYYPKNYIAYYTSHINDPKFMKFFLDNFYEKYKNVPIFRSINSIYNLYYILMGGPREDYSEVINDLKASMKDFLTKYTTKIKDGKRVPDIKRTREIAMFAIHYERCENLGISLQEIQDKKSVIADAKEDLESRLDHYRALLEGAITPEEIEAYSTEVTKLMRKLGGAE